MPIPRLSPRAVLVVALAVTALGLLAAPSGASGKTVKCKTGQMLVKVGKKAVCKRTTTLFPNPKPADARVEFVKFALAPATSKPPGKRGKRVRTFASFKAAKKVRKSILRLLPKVLAKVDAAQPVKAASLVARGSADPVARAAGCTAPEKPSTYTSKDGNSTMSASVSAEGTEIGFDGTTSGGITIHFTYLTDAGCDPLKVPACPQASGEVTAQGTKFDNVLMDIKQNGKVLSHTNVKGKRATKATGQNAADAKLDWVRIEDVLSSSVTVQGPGFPRTTISGSFSRTAVWDMRADRWQEDKFQVKVAGNIQVDEDVASFSNLVRSIVSSFRKAQDEGSLASPAGWSKPASKCATVDWSPASDAIKVSKNKTGTATGTIKASTGGTAADGKSKVTGQSNGTFSPTDVNGATPAFNYTVTGDSGVLSMNVEVTSTAGAGLGEWHQPIEKKDSPNRISGTFSGRDAGSTLLKQWSGSATWKRAPNLDESNTSRRYYLESATYTAEISGADDICQYSGSKTFAFSAQPTLASFTIYNPAADVVFGTPDKDWVLPFDYAWAIIPPPNEGTFKYTAHDCAPPYEANNGQEFIVSVPSLSSGHLAKTSDGTTFAGTSSPPDGSESWSFVGSD